MTNVCPVVTSGTNEPMPSCGCPSSNSMLLSCGIYSTQIQIDDRLVSVPFATDTGATGCTCSAAYTTSTTDVYCVVHCSAIVIGFDIKSVVQLLLDVTQELRFVMRKFLFECQQNYWLTNSLHDITYVCIFAV